MKTFLIIFIVWLVLFLFAWALVHGAKLQRERMGFTWIMPEPVRMVSD